MIFPHKSKCLHNKSKTSKQERQKFYAQRDLFPYPFDRNIEIIPFPLGFEIPKFDKYKGWGNIEDHIKEFYVACMEVGYNDSHLIHLFPHCLGGPTIEWFSHLPLGIQTFQDIINQFVDHFSYNLDMDIILEVLYTLKQNKGESFANFLQRWRHRAIKIKWPIPKEQQIGIIISNVDTDLSFQLKMQCVASYEELIPRVLNIERALITQGNTQAYKDKCPSTSSNEG